MIDSTTAESRASARRGPQSPVRIAALVLGAAVWPGERPSPTLERRASHGARLWLEGAVDIVIGCGGIGQNPPSEAELIRRICLSHGVPQSALLLEDRSTSTLENIRNAKPLLTKASIGHVILVTDAYHAPRARLIAQKLGLVCSSASPDPGGTPRSRRLRSALREVPAWAYYRFWPGAMG